jgi:hypothetical protein
VIGHGPHTPAGPIQVEIDEVVLEGFSPSDRERIGTAARQELERLLRAGGYRAARSHQVATIDAGSFRLRPSMDAAAVGEEVARAVHRGLLS